MEHPETVRDDAAARKFVPHDRELMRALLLFLMLALPLILIPSIAITVGVVRIPDSVYLYRRVQEAPPAPTIVDLPTAAPSPADIRAITEKVAVGYSPEVISALRKMGIGVSTLNSWITADPRTALRKIKYMSADIQAGVASTALFITKINPRIDARTAWREAAALAHYSMKYGIPPALATAVAHTESTFDPNALSKKGASGVMQVMWRLHDQLLTANGITSSGGRNPLSDPEQAIAAGCLLLSRYLRAYGSVAGAMERYYGSRSDSYRRKIDRSLANFMYHHAEARR